MSVQVQGPQQRPAVEPAMPSDGASRPAPPPPGPTQVTTAPMATAPQASARRRPAFLTRRVLLPVVVVVLIVVGVFAIDAWRESSLYVSTDNAQLSGQPIQVGAMNAGKVDAIMPTIGATVHKGDVIAQVALPSQVGVGQAGQAKMGFLGAGDTHVDVQAPVDGIVIASRIGHTRDVSAERLTELLRRSGSARTLGVVANCVQRKDLERSGFPWAAGGGHTGHGRGLFDPAQLEHVR